jgi:hypothetical protein
MDWSDSELGEVEHYCEHGNEPLGSIKLLTGYTTGRFLNSAQLHRVS